MAEVACCVCLCPFEPNGDQVTCSVDCRREHELQRNRQRSKRKHTVRAHTVAINRLTKRELEAGRLLYPPARIVRPKTREDCGRIPRPCPFVSCRWHLYLDVSAKTGSIKLNFPDLEPHELEHSCALDVADAGGATLEDVGEMLNITRERVRQLEGSALRKLFVVRSPLREYT